MGGTGTGASFSFFWTGELAAQWYAIDVSSGSPVFQMVGGSQNIGREAFGANTYCYEPAIDINSKGQIGLGFMESDTTGGAINPATGGWISTFVTARNPTDAAGMMATPVLVSAGKGTAAITGRIGDFSGMNVDPVNGTFWHSNEFGGGGPTVIANFTPDIAPTLTPPTAPQTSVEGASQSFSLGSFADPDGGPWTVDVSWGDGMPHTVFTATAPGTITPQNHTYGEEGAYTGTITVTDTSDGQFDSELFSVNVADADLTAGATVLQAGKSGVPFSGVEVGSFTDANPGAPVTDFSGVTDWGDGSPTSLATFSNTGPGAFNVTGSHTYAKPGVYTVTTNVVDDGGETTRLTSKFTITDLPVTGSTKNFTAVEGQGTGLFVLATFTDPDTLATVADVNAQLAVGGWGDHTPGVAGITLTVQQIGVTPLTSATDPGAPIFEVLGSHTYAEETPAGTPDPLSVVVTTLGGVSTTLTSPAGGGVTVLDAALTSSNGTEITGIGGSPTGSVLLGTFRDANQAATNLDFLPIADGGNGGSVVVNWGDGSSQTLTDPTDITASGSPNGGIFSVTAAHTYPIGGTYAYSVTVTDAGGSVTTFSGSAIIASSLHGGPVIDGMYFNRLNGQVDYIIKDPIPASGGAPSGVSVNTLLDSSNYLLTKVHAGKAYPGKWVVTDVTAAPDPTIAYAFDVAVTFNGGAIIQGGFYLFTIRDSSNGNSSVQDLAGNHLDGEFYGSFPSGNGINGSDFVAELQAFHNKIFAPQTIIGTANARNGGNGGLPVAPVHSGILVPVVPRGGSPIFSTSTSPSNGGDPPATGHKTKAKGHIVVKIAPKTSTVKASLVKSKSHPAGPLKQWFPGLSVLTQVL